MSHPQTEKFLESQLEVEMVIPYKTLPNHIIHKANPELENHNWAVCFYQPWFDADHPDVLSIRPFVKLHRDLGIPLSTSL